MCGNHLDDFILIFTDILFGKNTGVDPGSINNNASSRRNCLIHIFPFLAVCRISLRYLDAFLRQFIVQRFLKGRIFQHLLSGTEKKAPRLISKRYQSRYQIDELSIGIKDDQQQRARYRSQQPGKTAVSMVQHIIVQNTRFHFHVKFNFHINKNHAFLSTCEFEHKHKPVIEKCLIFQSRKSTYIAGAFSTKETLFLFSIIIILNF